MNTNQFLITIERLSMLKKQNSNLTGDIPLAKIIDSIITTNSTYNIKSLRSEWYVEINFDSASELLNLNIYDAYIEHGQNDPQLKGYLISSEMIDIGNIVSLMSFL